MEVIKMEGKIATLVDFSESEELYHHGILGQKWGVRRYQNKDGSLTSAGRKRAEKLANEYEKTTGKKVTDHAYRNSGSSKKSVSEMSDDELMERSRRLRVEKDFYEAQKNQLQTKQQLEAITPKETSKGKEFAKKVFNDVIEPAAVNVGKSYLEKTLKDALGIKVDESNSLKDLAEKAGYEKKIAEANMAKRKDKKEKEEAEKKAKEEAEKKAKEEAEKKDKEEAEKVNTGTVQGEGTSRHKGSKEGPVVDDPEYTENVNQNHYNNSYDYNNYYNYNNYYDDGYNYYYDNSYDGYDYEKTVDVSNVNSGQRFIENLNYDDDEKTRKY